MFLRVLRILKVHDSEDSEGSIGGQGLWTPSSGQTRKTVLLKDAGGILGRQFVCMTGGVRRLGWLRRGYFDDERDGFWS